MHERLRESMALARRAIDGEVEVPEGMDLLVFCRGFCSALSGHHGSEDAALFPQILAERPDLEPVIDKLKQDHSMIEYLVGDLSAALDSGAAPADLHRHLDGIGAIMESHFGYEERRLLRVLESISPTGTPEELLGPLA